MKQLRRNIRAHRKKRPTAARGHTVAHVRHHTSKRHTRGVRFGKPARLPFLRGARVWLHKRLRYPRQRHDKQGYRRRLISRLHIPGLMPIVGLGVAAVAAAGVMYWNARTPLSTAAPKSEPVAAAPENPQEYSNTVRDDYADLPPAVSQAVPAVVAFQRITDDKAAQGNAYSAEVASAVIISGNEALTAGHSLMPKASLTCSNTILAAPGAQNSRNASHETVVSAAALHDQRQDIGLVTVSPSDNFQQLAHLEPSTSVPRTGEPLYFVNFQPTSDGKTRSPLASGELAHPAVFSGSFVAIKDGSLVIATGQGQNFGLGVADTLVRKGASGGAVLDGKGRLIGLSVTSDSLRADQTAAAIKGIYGVKMPAGTYQLAFAQRISGQLIAQLRAEQSGCSTTVTQMGNRH